MSDGMVGADPDLMEHFAHQCTNVASTIDDISRTVQTALLLAELPATSRPPLNFVIEQLGTLARLVDARAEELRLADAGFQPPWLSTYTRDATALSTMLAVASVDGDWVDFAVGFLAGNLGNLWNGTRDDTLPVGQLVASAAQIWRMWKWLGNTTNPSLFPTFTTGLVGQRVGSALRLLPESNVLGRIGTTFGSAGTTMFFRRVGVVGGTVGTVLGAYDLYQQGNPIDAYRREGAGYVADVASTAFSASTAAFFLAPHPVTGALVIATGVVWAGAEIVDHWEDITEWTSDTWHSTVDGAAVLWDYGTARLDQGLDTLGGYAGDTLDTIGDVASGVWDTGTSTVTRVAGALNPFD